MTLAESPASIIVFVQVKTFRVKTWMTRESLQFSFCKEWEVASWQMG